MTIKDQLKTISTAPGVYLFKGQSFDDAQDKILYVGKAKNLKKRVASYFGKNHDDSPKTRELVKRIVGIETVVVEKEIEALILENELIKKYRPPFNVVMRDDKNYLYIRVGLNDDYPTISFVRKVARDSAKYFGPYVDARSARRTIQLLQRVLPLCTAPPKSTKSGGQGKRAGRACLNYHIGQCAGVCVGEMRVDEYKETFQQVINFLNGQYGGVLKDLDKKMREAAQEKKYERAGRLRDGIAAIKQMTESQSVISPSLKEAIDVIGFDTKVNRSVVTLIQIRGGKMRNQLPFVMESKYETEAGEVLAGFIRDYYNDVLITPHIILVGEELRDKKTLEKWLSQKDKHKVKIVIPTRGLKRRLLKIANSNAVAKFEEVARKLKLETRFATEGIKELKKKLNLKKLGRIEAYDISNTSGADSVGAMVVFENGKMDNQQYRRFKIKSVEGSNDYASLGEVLARRFKKVPPRQSSGLQDGSFKKFPDLVMIDGGKGQVNAVAKVLKGNRIKLIGMAKGDHSAPKAKDEVIVYGQTKPLGLAKNSPAKYLLQQIRDEAHRFAYAYHTNIKRKQVRESMLEKVEGVGPATRKKLLKKFGSLTGVKNATEKEISDVVGKKTAKIIKQHV